MKELPIRNLHKIQLRENGCTNNIQITNFYAIALFGRAQ